MRVAARVAMTAVSVAGAVGFALFVAAVDRWAAWANDGPSSPAGDIETARWD